jgi:mono/diheme cytochrome c family protein
MRPHVATLKNRQSRLLAAAWLTGCVATVAHAGPDATPPALQPVTVLNGPAAEPTAAERGRHLYAYYCTTCHGSEGDGRGRAAELFTPRPANLRTSEKNDAYMELIVRLGGTAMGRSSGMPPWSAELNAEQIRDVVAYVRSFNTRR